MRPGRENDDPHPSENQFTPYRKALIASGARGPLQGHPLFDFFLVNDGPLSALDAAVRERVLPAALARLP